MEEHRPVRRTGQGLHQVPRPSDHGPEVDSLFTCDVHNFETDQVSFLNGWYVGSSDGLKKMPDGVIVGSIAAAFKKYPELIEKHYGKYADPGQGPVPGHEYSIRTGRAVHLYP